MTVQGGEIHGRERGREGEIRCNDGMGRGNVWKEGVGEEGNEEKEGEGEREDMEGGKMNGGKKEDIESGGERKRGREGGN